ncbi:MAG: formylglycine-generating enzyme family protein [Candidatus Brocadiia bacterium]
MKRNAQSAPPRGQTKLLAVLLVFAVVAAVGAWLAFSLTPSPPRVEKIAYKDAPIPLVAVYPGAFMMGTDNSEDVKHNNIFGQKTYNDEAPIHRVDISYAFFIGATEVTQAQYRAVMNANPSYFKGDDLPVDTVSWNDAFLFCANLTERERAKGSLPPGMEYRLPTEAEWEYCCRAGSTMEFSSAGDFEQLLKYMWCDGNSEGCTHRVGSRKPNAWGLYDMHGNVWEWCGDWYSAEYRAEWELDPVGSQNGSSRVLRGGAWSGYMVFCRSANRYSDFPFAKDCTYGLRVVVGPAPGQKN